MAAATIELGEIGGSAEVAPSGHQLPGNLRRIMQVLALVAASLTGITGSAGGSLALGTPLWTGEVSLAGFTLGSRNLYLYEPNGRVGVARDLATGAMRWRLGLDELPQWTDDLGFGVAAVTTRTPHNFDGVPPDPNVIIVDDATGTVLGRARGWLVGVTSSGRMLLATESGGDPERCPTWPDGCADIAAHDLRTGRQVWRRSLPGYGISPRTVGATFDSFLLVRDGTVTAYSGDTGEAVDSISTAGSESSEFGLTALAGDTVLVVRRLDRSVAITAYRWGPARRVWSVTVVDLPEQMSRPGWLFPDRCGRALCMQIDGGTVVIDLATGRHLTTIGLDVRGALGGGHLLATPPGVSDRANFGAPVHVVDPRSGRIVTTVPFSAVVPWTGSGGRALLLSQGPERTSFILLGPGGRPESLGSVAGVDLNCQARADVLACAEPAGGLRVWRLPRGAQPAVALPAPRSPRS